MSKKTKMIYNIRWSLQAQVERLERRKMKYMRYYEAPTPGESVAYVSNKGREKHINRQLERLSGLILHKDSDQFQQDHRSN